MSDDLDSLLHDDPLLVCLHFPDSEGQWLTCGLSVGAKSLAAAQARADCPKNRQSLEYYTFLCEQAEASPAAEESLLAPVIKRDQTGRITGAWHYTVSHGGNLNFAPCGKDALTVLHFKDAARALKLWQETIGLKPPLTPRP